MRIGQIEIFPTKIICLGRNYLDHALEMKKKVPKEPLFFYKGLNTLILNEESIIYPKLLQDNEQLNRVDHEVELAVIIKKKGKYINKKEVENHILGYSIFLDITARKMQKLDRTSNLPWYRSKSFDSFGPIGPKIALSSEIRDPHNLDIELCINNKLRQSSNTKHLIFKIPYLIEYISQFMTLYPGDIIATGTPGGVGPIQPGDRIEACIEYIGTLVNPVILGA